MKNTVKEKIRAGSVVVGAQLRFGSSAIAEMFGHAGFDFLAPLDPQGQTMGELA